MQNNNKIKYNSLNTLKGLACIGVVIMHCGFPGLFGKLVHYSFKFNVPVFLLISGFFLYCLLPQDEPVKIRKQLPKIFKMLLFSFVSYGLFFLALHYFVADVSIHQWLGEVFRLDAIIPKLFLGTFFNGTLWYLYALIWGYVLLLLISKWIPIRKITILAPILLFVHIALRTYVRAQGYEWYDASYFRSCILYAIPYILLGYTIAQNKDRILAWGKDYYWVIIAILGFLLQFVEYGIFKQSLDFYFGSIFYSVALFVLAVRHPSVKVNEALNYLGEKLSMPIYIAHLAVIELLLLCPMSPYLRPVLVVLCSIAVAYVWNMFFGKKKIVK